MAYYAAMEAMTTRLVPLFATALGLPDAYFAEAFAEPNCTIRLIHYPPQPDPGDNEFGFAPHTDNNFITFLAQSALPGLEVRTEEGEWIRPPAIPGTFVVNTGAMLARYSNDRFKATPHRVINRNDRSRYAIPFFLGPNHDSLVAPVSTCTGPDNPPRYEPTTYGDFTERLFTLNFAHRRSEEPAPYAGKSFRVVIPAIVIGRNSAPRLVIDDATNRIHPGEPLAEERSWGCPRPNSRGRSMSRRIVGEASSRAGRRSQQTRHSVWATGSAPAPSSG